MIIAFVSDLYFTSRIDHVAQTLGYRVDFYPDLAQFLPASRRNPDDQDEGGLLAGFIAKIVDHQPALIVFDLDNHKVPWEKGILALKGSPQSKSIPILTFGPHVQVGQQAKANKAGADHVFTKERLLQALPKLLSP